MSLDFSSLGDLAKAGVAKPFWSPLTPQDLRSGDVLAFDQSLTASGYVRLVKGGDGRVAVIQAGMLKVGHGDLRRGIEQDLRRGTDIFIAAQKLIGYALAMGADLAHESPPNPQAVKGSGTSSLMAAQAIRCAVAAAGGEIEMLGSQPAKRLICGNATRPKAEVHAVLKADVMPWIEGSDLVTNEATRDALMVALLHLARKKEQQ